MCYVSARTFLRECIFEGMTMLWVEREEKGYTKSVVLRDHIKSRVFQPHLDDNTFILMLWKLDVAACTLHHSYV